MKKILLALLSIGLIALVWYLFIRPFELGVNFKAATLPGDVIQTLRIWDRSLDAVEITGVDSVYSVTQNVQWQNRKYVYTWTFEVEDDSVSKVFVKITEPSRELVNKLLIPFTEQNIERDAKAVVGTFYNILNEHLEITKVRVEGESQIRPSFCVCSTLETMQVNKANGMMKDYGLLTAFVGDHQLQMDGPPIVEVLQWSHTKGEIKFDFCFPIVKTDSLPRYENVHYKWIQPGKALKAIYHGNYITSDRAWYELMRYAQANGYEVKGFPVEIFFNNPNLGADEENWRADIFLPVN